MCGEAVVSTAHPRLQMEVREVPSGERRAALIGEVRRGLCATPKILPAQLLHDQHGDALWQEIARQPEHYQARAEHALFTRIADEVIAEVRPTDLVDLGAGIDKTRLLLDAVRRHESWTRLLPVGTSESELRRTSATLIDEYPWLEVQALAGDPGRDLEHLPRGGRRLVVMPGRSLASHTRSEAARMLARLACVLDEGDQLLVGVDLVKPRRVLEAAGNDAAGKTAAWTKNLLEVLNRELDACFDPELYRHRAVWNELRSRVELHLVAVRAHRVAIPGAGLTVRLAAGEAIRAAVSHKYRPLDMRRLFEISGFRLSRLYAGGGVALALAERIPLGAVRDLDQNGPNSVNAPDALVLPFSSAAPNLPIDAEKTERMVEYSPLAGEG